MMQNTYSKNDLRVKRTQKLIFDALIECTNQKGFSNVTVSDITLSAGINRATFYRHYKDKIDLLNQYAKTISDMLNIPNKGVNKNGSHSLPSSLVKIFEHIRENATFYRVMLGKNGDPDFVEEIRMYVHERIRNSLPNNLKLDKKRLDLFVNYSAYASFGTVLWWLEHNMPYSSEEMIQILQKLESENLKAFLQ